MTEKMLDPSKSDDLTARQRRAIPFIAIAPSIIQGCRQAKISKDLYYKWMEDVTFREALRKAQDDIVEESFSLLKSNSVLAVETLAYLTSSKDFPAVQRSAANDLLNQLVKFKEAMDLEARINELEQKLAQGTKT